MAARDPVTSLTALGRALPLMSREAMQAVAREAEEECRRTTAFHDRTGRLRRSIRAGVLNASPLRTVIGLTAGADDAEPGRGGDWATSSRTYAPMVELGTSRQAPRPFLGPTMRTLAARGEVHKAFQTRWRRWSP